LTLAWFYRSIEVRSLAVKNAWPTSDDSRL